MGWAMVGGFVALAALMVGLIRDVKRDTRRQIDDARAENREMNARTNQRIDDMRAEVRETRSDLRTEVRETNARTDRRIDDMRAENRETNARTDRRIDDMRATGVAIIPRATTEPGDASPPRGSRREEIGPRGHEPAPRAGATAEPGDDAEPVAAPLEAAPGQAGVETGGSLDKTSAMAKVNEHMGRELLSHHNTIFANINSAKDVWWLNVHPRKFGSDLHIILMKQGGSGLIWLRITAGFISAPEEVFRVRPDNGLVDVEISSRRQRYMKDVKNGGTGYDFRRHVEYEWTAG